MRSDLRRCLYVALLALMGGLAYLVAAWLLTLAYIAVLEPDTGPQVIFAVADLPEPGEPVLVTAATASWYGHPFIGRTTASGEMYTGEDLSAAHVAWPFGTWVQLVNPDNGKTIAVRITDRGPYDFEALREGKLRPHPTRDLDLSVAAAEALGIVEQGVAELEARVLVWGDDEATNNTRAEAR